MKNLSLEEIQAVSGASREGAMTVMAAITVGAAIGSVVPGVGTAIGAAAGGISAGVHALILWNLVN
jgi:hypothetical protein